ncbi:MAG: hypothetical protein KF767_06980 [Bdellovibrionaceae bacterium]|nr:hypothetical protein [Pseudobdellovibrionaceae bacterium]
MKLKRRILKSPFKVSERLRFQRFSLVVIVVLALLLLGPWGLYLKSFDPEDYQGARARGQLLEKIFSFNSSAVEPGTRNRFLSEHFQLEEGTVAGLLPGAEKLVQFPPGTEALANPRALISFHGFQANRQEISPVIEDVSTQTGMPVFFSRVNHHGVQGDDLAGLSLDDYMQAVIEAEVTAKQLAPEAAVIGVSTGAPMAMLMAARSKLNGRAPVKTLILVSPNFGLPRWDWKFMIGPLGTVIARVATGGHHEWKPLNEEQAKFWVHRTSAFALRAMAEIVDLGMRAGKTRADWHDVDVLWVRNPQDDVVDARKAEAYLRGFQFRRLEIFDLAADNHILAGRIVKPENSARLTERIVQFLKESKTESN